MTDNDPLAGTPWSAPGTVAGFVQSPPNESLLTLAGRERARGATMAVDLGCGAGRNLIPLAEQGWTILGTDLSRPMLTAAAQRIRDTGVVRAAVVLAPMEQLPVRTRSADLIIAHGIWNLARTTAQFRAAVREAARIARPAAALFVFTFSRGTLPAGAAPVAGERFVYTQFSGQPQIFLTADDLLAEMGAAGFSPDRGLPVHELNRRRPGVLTGAPPVILEGAFRAA